MGETIYPYKLLAAMKHSRLGFVIYLSRTEGRSSSRYMLNIPSSISRSKRNQQRPRVDAVLTAKNQLVQFAWKTMVCVVRFAPAAIFLFVFLHEPNFTPNIIRQTQEKETMFLKRCTVLIFTIMSVLCRGWRTNTMIAPVAE